MKAVVSQSLCFDVLGVFWFALGVESVPSNAAAVKLEGVHVPLGSTAALCVCSSRIPCALLAAGSNGNILCALVVGLPP